MFLECHIRVSVAQSQTLMMLCLRCLVAMSFACSRVSGGNACLVCTWDILEGQRWHVRSHMAGPCAADALQESQYDISSLNQQMLQQGSQQMQQRMDHNLPSSPPLEVSASTT